MASIKRFLDYVSESKYGQELLFILNGGGREDEVMQLIDRIEDDLTYGASFGVIVRMGSMCGLNHKDYDDRCWGVFCDDVAKAAVAVYDNIER